MALWRILLVDDERRLTEVFRLLLEGTGRFVVEEENLGQQALLAARQFQPQLIFLDMDLPDKNGAEIAADLSRDPQLCLVPIVFLTGALTRHEAEEANLQGCWRTLAKPFTFAELLQVIEEVLIAAARLAA